MITQMTDEMKSLIIKIQLSENEIINDRILKDDSKFKDSLMNIDDKLIAVFDNKKDLELTKILEEIFSVILFNSFTNEKSAFHINLSINENNENKD